MKICFLPFVSLYVTSFSHNPLCQNFILSRFFSWFTFFPHFPHTPLDMFQTNRAFYDLPLSSLLPSSDIKFGSPSCHCPSVTIEKFSYLPVDDFARRKSFSEKPLIPNWRACSFNPNNSVRCFLNSNTLEYISFSTGTRLRWRLIATSSTWLDRMNKQRAWNITAGRFVGSSTGNCSAKWSRALPAKKQQDDRKFYSDL